MFSYQFVNDTIYFLRKIPFGCRCTEYAWLYDEIKISTSKHVDEKVWLLFTCRQGLLNSTDVFRTYIDFSVLYKFISSTTGITILPDPLRHLETVIVFKGLNNIEIQWEISIVMDIGYSNTKCLKLALYEDSYIQTYENIFHRLSKICLAVCVCKVDDNPRTISLERLHNCF